MAKILITIPDEKYNNLMYGESVDEEDAFELKTGAQSPSSTK